MGDMHPELGKLKEQFTASAPGWIVILCLGILTLVFIGVTAFLIIDSGKPGGWPIPVVSLFFGIYWVIVSLFYRRGAVLRIYDKGFSYFSGHQKNILNQIHIK